MKTKEILLRACTSCAGLFLLSQWCGNAHAQVLFLDNFEQFGNGADLTSTNYTPASGPGAASVVTSVQNGSPTIRATNFLGSTWALFDNSVVLNKNQYEGLLSSVQYNQPLQVTWKMWIQATNTGPGMFLFSIPTSDPVANYNPPVVFMDTGVIIALTNGTSVQTPIGTWGPLAGTVMTNTLILDYPNGTFSYSLNGQTLATLPLGPYFTSVVGAIYFNGFERSAGSLGNRFAISDVTVAIQGVPTIQFTASPTSGVPPLTVQFNSTNVDSLGNTITSWNWNFGDGAISTAQNPSHTYTTAGTFNPSLVATNNHGVAVLGFGPQIATLTSTSSACFTYTTNNGAITITGYTCLGGAVMIPSLINGLPVTTIGDEAFLESGLTSVTIPNSVTNIGDLAFIFSDYLKSVTIPNSVIRIGNQAFISCNSLTTISVDPNNPAYSSLAGVLFNKSQTMLIQCPGGITGSYAIPNTVTNIGDQAFSGTFLLTSVTIPNSVISIGFQAFVACRLTRVTIPNTVTSIGDGAFDGCPKLTTISVDPTNPAYSSLGGVLFDKSQTMLIQYPGGITGSYVIPNTVTNIGDVSFDDCEGLTSVTIPNSVTSISSNGLYGEGAFDYCTSLTNVTMGNSLTSIGANAFESCTKLTGVYFQGNAPSPANDPTVFSGDPNAAAYYLPRTTGWGATFDGIPTVLWNPQIQTSGVSFGVRTNRFGFNITGTSGLLIVVEACTNLANPVWSPVATNTLTGGTSYFSDPQWTNYPARLYRLRSP